MKVAFDQSYKYTRKRRGSERQRCELIKRVCVRAKDIRLFIARKSQKYISRGSRALRNFSNKPKKRRLLQRRVQIALFVVVVLIMYKISSFSSGDSSQTSTSSCQRDDKECLSKEQLHIFSTQSLLSSNIRSISGGLVGCSCCGWSGPEELVVDRSCPKCASQDRERLTCYEMDTEEVIQSAFRQSKPKIININAHTHVVDKIFSRADLTILDSGYFEPDGKFEYFGAQIDLPSAKYDGIIAVHVVEHSKRDKELLREFIRLLKRGSWLIVEVPCREKEFLKSTKHCLDMNPEETRQCSGQHNHLRLYSCEEFSDMLIEVGFECSQNADMPMELQRLFLVEKSTKQQWLCKKKRFADVGIGLIKIK